tara:strand:- start:1872 stop:2219 length:348 start_codon:yes stop_codon:yes gene_type:complete
MKTDVLKKLIKEAVKEAIQDELKDILLEAVKSPKTQIIRESIQPTTNPSPPPTPTHTEPTMDVRKSYMDVLGETSLNFNSNDAPSFNPQGIDPINGSLGEGSVEMDTIMNLLNTK